MDSRAERTKSVREQEVSVPLEGSRPLPGGVKVSAEGADLQLFLCTAMNRVHLQTPRSQICPGHTSQHPAARTHLKGWTDVID